MVNSLSPTVLSMAPTLQSPWPLGATVGRAEVGVCVSDTVEVKVVEEEEVEGISLAVVEGRTVAPASSSPSSPTPMNTRSSGCGGRGGKTPSQCCCNDKSVAAAVDEAADSPS